ncbi:MAG: Txe/YoeB family addiction module toxin [Saprospiraceae bacterium]
MLPIEFSATCEDDIRKLGREDAKLSRKLWELILDINRDPYHGIGQPEALRGDLSGWHSRRLNDKHRLVYKVEQGVLKLASCYGHYDDR